MNGDWLQLFISGGSSVAAIAFVWWLSQRDRADLREAIRDIQQAIPQCQKERRDHESELHDRVTGAEKEIAYLKGLKNGNGGHA